MESLPPQFYAYKQKVRYVSKTDYETVKSITKIGYSIAKTVSEFIMEFETDIIAICPANYCSIEPPYRIW